MAKQNLEAMAAALEASGEYKILRRIEARALCQPSHNGDSRLGCIVDVETTGLDPKSDEIIQLAILPFRFEAGPEARIIDILMPFDRYREPSKPISPAITALTGIENKMVQGQVIDPSEVGDFVASVELVIAHNAAFDFSFLERFCPFAFMGKKRACSHADVPWSNEAFRGSALIYLAMQCGWFARSHDALEDCARRSRS